MKLRPVIKALPIPLLGLLGLGSIAAAETLTYGADVGVAETDNVTLAATNRISQTIAVADVDFDIKQQTRLLDLDAKGNFSDLDYLQGAFSNQFVGRFDGVGKYALIPERLTWVVQDDFGQAALDPFTPTTPNNLEDVNYFSTGPDVALRFGPTYFLNMSARVARAQYQTSPFNSNRVLATLAGGMQLSPNSSVSLNADTERVLFENTLLNTDFDRTNAFVRYELQGARTDFSADLGATKIEQGGESTTGPLAKIRLTRKISNAAKLVVSLGRDLTDGASSFSNGPGGSAGVVSGPTNIVGAAPIALTSTSYTSNYGSVAWQYTRNRTTISVGGRWEKDVYDHAGQFDNTIEGADFSVERRLTHAFTAQILGRLNKTTYPNGIFVPENTGILPTGNGPTVATQGGSSHYETGLVGVALVWHHGRALEVRLRCEHSSESTTGFDASYHENRVYLTVGYRPRPADPQEENDPGAYAPG
jgi:hypothetical protein